MLLGGRVVAHTTQAWRVVETSHPPTYYVPADDCAVECFERAPGASVCEWKGEAVYWTVRAGDAVAVRACWSYPRPTPAFASIRDHRAFYPAAFSCFVDGERVRAQPGRFYGGWVTDDVVGPFKGEPGSERW